MVKQLSFAEYVNAAVKAIGGKWEPYNDQTNTYVKRVSLRRKVPPNLLKAAINAESSGNWERDGSRLADVGRGEPMLPYVGIFASTAASWGYDFNRLIGNEELQIDAMAKGLRQEYDSPDNQYGWVGATRWYFSGSDEPNSFVDEFGKSADTHTTNVVSDWKALDKAAKFPGIPPIIPPINWPDLGHDVADLGDDLVDPAVDAVWGPIQAYLTEWLPRIGSMGVGLVLLAVGMVVVLK
jgi:hypothetical protein